MGSDNTAAIVLFLSFHILFFALVSGSDTNSFPTAIPTTTSSFSNLLPTTTWGFPDTIPTTTSGSSNSLPMTTSGFSNSIPTTNYIPTPTSSSSNMGRCPRDALKLGVCVNVLNLVDVVVGSPPTMPCCSLLQGLVDLEAAVCLCTAIKANLLGINLDIPLSVSLVLNNCGRNVPNGFECN